MSPRQRPTPLGNLSDQENESENELNRRHAAEPPAKTPAKSPLTARQLEFSANSPATPRTPRTPSSDRPKRVSPGVRKTIVKSPRECFVYQTPSKLSKHVTPTAVPEVLISGRMTAVKYRTTAPASWLNAQEAILTRWVNSLLSSEHSSLAPPLGIWEFSVVLKYRLRALHTIFVQESVQSSLARLNELLTKCDISVGAHVSFRTNRDTRQVIAKLLVDNYDPNWLLCTLCVVFGSHLGSRVDEALHIEGMSETDPGSENVFQNILETLVFELLFSGFDDLHSSVTTKQLDADFNATVLSRVLTVIYLMDVAKNKRFVVFEEDPPLFRTESLINASEDVVRQIIDCFAIQINIATEHCDVYRFLAHEGYHLEFRASSVEELYDLSTDNLVEGLRDGARLAKLTSIVTRETSPIEAMQIISETSGSREDRLHTILRNLNISIYMLKRFVKTKLNDSVRIQTTAEEIVSGDREAIIRLLWQIADVYTRSCLLNDKTLKDEINAQEESLTYVQNTRDESSLSLTRPSFSPVSEVYVFGDDSSKRASKKLLLKWAALVCKHYGKTVNEYMESFRDGVALCLLIHHYDPDLLDFDKLKNVTSTGVTSPRSKELELVLVKKNFSMFQIAARQLGGIPMLPLVPKIAVSPAFTRQKEDSFGNLMYLLVAYIFRRVVYLSLNEEALEKLLTSLEEGAASAPLQTAASNKPRGPAHAGWNSPRERTPVHERNIPKYGVNPIVSPVNFGHPVDFGTVGDEEGPNDSSCEEASVAVVQRAIRRWNTHRRFLDMRHAFDSAAALVQCQWRTFLRRREAHEKMRKNREMREFYKETQESTFLLVEQIRRMFANFEGKVSSCKKVYKVMTQVERTQASILIQREMRRHLVHRAMEPVRVAVHAEAGSNVAEAPGLVRVVSNPVEVNVTPRVNVTTDPVNVRASTSKVSGTTDPVDAHVKTPEVNVTTDVVDARVSANSRPNLATLGAAIAAGGTVLAGLSKAYDALNERGSFLENVLDTAVSAFDTHMNNVMIENAKKAAAATAGLAALASLRRKDTEDYTADLNDMSEELRQVYQDRDQAEERWGRLHQEVPAVNEAPDLAPILAALQQAENRDTQLTADIKSAEALAKDGLVDFDRLFGRHAQLIEAERLEAEQEDWARQDEIEREREVAKQEQVKGFELEFESAIIVVQNWIRRFLVGQRLETKREEDRLTLEARGAFLGDVLDTAALAFDSHMADTMVENDKKTAVASAGLASLASLRRQDDEDASAEMETMTEEIRLVSEDMNKADETWEDWHAAREDLEDYSDWTTILAAVETSEARDKHLGSEASSAEDSVEDEVLYFHRLSGEHVQLIEAERLEDEEEELAKQKEIERSLLGIVFDAADTAFETHTKNAMYENARKVAAVTAGLAALASLRKQDSEDATAETNHLNAELRRVDQDGDQAEEIWQRLHKEIQAVEVASDLAPILAALRRSENRDAQLAADVLSAESQAKDGLAPFGQLFGQYAQLVKAERLEEELAKQEEARQVDLAMREEMARKAELARQDEIARRADIEKEKEVDRFFEDLEREQELERADRGSEVAMEKEMERAQDMDVTANRNATTDPIDIHGVTSQASLAPHADDAHVLLNTRPNLAIFVGAMAADGTVIAGLAKAYDTPGDRESLLENVFDAADTAFETHMKNASDESARKAAATKAGLAALASLWRQDKQDAAAEINDMNAELRQVYHDRRQAEEKWRRLHNEVDVAHKPSDLAPILAALRRSEHRDLQLIGDVMSAEARANDGLVAFDQLFGQHAKLIEAERIELEEEELARQQEMARQAEIARDEEKARQAELSRQEEIKRESEMEKEKEVNRFFEELEREQELERFDREREMAEQNERDYSQEELVWQQELPRKVEIRQAERESEVAKDIDVKEMDDMATIVQKYARRFRAQHRLEAKQHEHKVYQLLKTPSPRKMFKTLKQELDAMRMALVVVKGCVERDEQRRHVILALTLLDRLTDSPAQVQKLVDIEHSFDVVVQCISTCFDMSDVLSGCIVLLDKMAGDARHRALMKRRKEAVNLLVKVNGALRRREMTIQSTEQQSRSSSLLLDELTKRGIPVPSQYYEEQVETVYDNSLRSLWKQLGRISIGWADEMVTRK